MLKRIKARYKHHIEIRDLQKRVKYHFKHPERQSLMVHYVNGEKYYCHIWKDKQEVLKDKE